MISRQSIKQIIELGYKYDDVVMDTFSALLLTKNQVFKDFAQSKKDEWEQGEDMPINELASYVTMKCNKIVKQKKWNSRDLKDVNIIALTTQVEALRSRFDSAYNNPNNNNSGGGSNGGDKKSRTDIPAWRMKNVGPKKTVDGVTWWWYPDHKFLGVFDGLYMKHRHGAEHYLQKEVKDERRAEKRENEKKRKTEGSESIGGVPMGSRHGSNDEAAKSLKLSDNIKSVIMSKFSCTEEGDVGLVSDICQPCFNL